MGLKLKDINVLLYRFKINLSIIFLLLPAHVAGYAPTKKV